LVVACDIVLVGESNRKWVVVSVKFPSQYTDIQKKLILLYLVNIMELPISHGLITDFIILKEIMSYYELEEIIASMVEGDFLDAVQENEDAEDGITTHYYLTENGLSTLDKLVDDFLPRPVRQIIDKYVNENRVRIKKDYESTANYFPNVENNEFRVKCGVYEDKRALLELFISVDTREQAKLIQTNWRENTSKMYQQIIEVLTNPDSSFF